MEYLTRAALGPASPGHELEGARKRPRRGLEHRPPTAEAAEVEAGSVLASLARAGAGSDVGQRPAAGAPEEPAPKRGRRAAPPSPKAQAPRAPPSPKAQAPRAPPPPAPAQPRTPPEEDAAPAPRGARAVHREAEAALLECGLGAAQVAEFRALLARLPPRLQALHAGELAERRRRAGGAAQWVAAALAVAAARRAKEARLKWV